VGRVECDGEAGNNLGRPDELSVYTDENAPNCIPIVEDSIFGKTLDTVVIGSLVQVVTSRAVGEYGHLWEYHLQSASGRD
jgi:hypothetical protein